MDDLLPTLVQIFLTIKLGWLAGFYKIISPQDQKGINIFVTKFALPVLVFVSLASIDFSNVKWSFLLGVSISKILIFLVVGVVQFFIHSPRDMSRAAIFAIFCTNTNDLGMGFPIVDSVFGSDHPYVGLLYLLTPVSMLLLNPIGFTIMETDNTNKSRVKGGSGMRGKLVTFITVLRGLILNPVVSMTVLGLLANLVFSGQLPHLLLKFLRAIGSAFTSLAPFTLGLSMYGKLKEIRGTRLLPIMALVVIKSLITPFLTTYMVDKVNIAIDEDFDPGLNNFAFLYGTFPTALGVNSYAGMYSVDPDLISAALILVTISSAPLMFISASILDVIYFKHSNFLRSINKFVFPLSCTSLIGIVLIAVILIVRRRKLTVNHAVTMTLLFFGLEMAGSKIIRLCFGSHYIETVIYIHGFYSQSLGAAILSITILLSLSACTEKMMSGKSAKSKLFVLLLILTAPLMSGLLVTLLFFTRPLVKTDCYLEEDSWVTVTSLVVGLSSLVVVGLCLFITHRKPLSDNSVTTRDGKSACHRSGGQVFRHSILLILLCCGLISSLVVGFYRLTINYDITKDPRAIFKIMLYLNQTFTTGSGLLFMAVFAVDCCGMFTLIRSVAEKIKKKIQGERQSTSVNKDEEKGLTSPALLISSSVPPGIEENSEMAGEIPSFTSQGSTGSKASEEE